MRSLVSVLLACCLGFAWAADYTKLSPAEILQQVKSGKAVIVDVREESEWDEQHLKLAKSLPLSSIEGVDANARAKAIQDLPRDKVVFLHCKSGIRCMKAANLLEKDGLKVMPIKAPYPALEAVFGRAAVPVGK